MKGEIQKIQETLKIQIRQKIKQEEDVKEGHKKKK